MKPPHSDPYAPIDLAAALKRTMGDVAFLKEMLGAFAASLPDQLATIATALNDRSPGDLAAAAHKLKGTALNLSVGNLAQSARVVERIGREDRLEAGADAFARLKKDCAEFESHLALVNWAALSSADTSDISI